MATQVRNEQTIILSYNIRPCIWGGSMKKRTMKQMIHGNLRLAESYMTNLPERIGWMLLSRIVKAKRNASLLTALIMMALEVKIECKLVMEGPDQWPKKEPYDWRGHHGHLSCELGCSSIARSQLVRNTNTEWGTIIQVTSHLIIIIKTIPSIWESVLWVSSDNKNKQRMWQAFGVCVNMGGICGLTIYENSNP